MTETKQGQRPKKTRNLMADAEGRLDAAMEFLRQNYKNPIGASALARAVGHSPASFPKDFINRYGCSVIRARSELQMTEAMRLLLDGVAISEICHRCGFGSITHFSKRFTVIVGKSPTNWLRSQGVASNRR